MGRDELLVNIEEVKNGLPWIVSSVGIKVI